METTLPHQQTRRCEVVDVRATAKSVHDTSRKAITRLEGIIVQQGEYTAIATEMRDVCAAFEKLAGDLNATSEFVDAALKS